MNKSRLEVLYLENIRPALMENLGLKNVMQLPKITKVVLNVGVKDAVGDSRALNVVVDVLTRISGQKPVKTFAKKSIAGFKLREGMPIGVMVTLRGKAMYEFLDKLINLALPQIRDFQGVTDRFDGRGGYNLGLKEWIIFPEVEYGISEKIHGMNISIQTTAKVDQHGYELLKQFGMPFIRRERKAKG
jgi:large subunit ribosomal protein L5